MKFNLVKSAIALCLFFVTISGHAELVYEPIATYLSWKRDPTTTMVVQWVTLPGQNDDEIYYRKEGENSWQIAVGSHALFPFNQPYALHRVELTHLTPNTAYTFRAGWKSKEYKFKTLPQNLDEPLRFVVGGDMYHDDVPSLVNTSKYAALQDPSFALVGGDIAYTAVGKRNRPNEMYNRWLIWLIAWNRYMVTSDGFLIPVVTAIGNHDTDIKRGNTAKFFYFLFPFPGDQGCNVLDVGDYLSIFALDTGHTHPIPGSQAYWLYTALEKRQQIPNKFAFYHVPAYPCVHKHEAEVPALIRTNWIPFFEKFGISTAFEHHGHAYKRTHPIYQGKINYDRGILYLGEGAWGVDKPRIPRTPANDPFMAVTASERHFILTTLTKNARYYHAINPRGKLIDYTMQSYAIPPQAM